MTAYDAAPCRLADDPTPWLNPPNAAFAAIAIAQCSTCPALTECQTLSAQVRPTSGVWAGRRYHQRSNL